MYYVYVLESQRGRGLYIGYTANLRERFRRHQTQKNPATAHRGPWRLIYYEAYVDQRDALGREQYLKSGSGRKFLKTQIRHYLSESPRAAATRESTV